MRKSTGTVHCLVAVAALIALAPAKAWGPLGPTVAHGQNRPSPEPAPIQVKLGPYVRYTSPSQAIVSWWTEDEIPSILDYGLAGPRAKYSPSIQLLGRDRGELENRVEDERPKRHHALAITGLQPNRVYAYRITLRKGNAVQSTEVYELDTAVNYSVRPLPTGLAIAGDPEHAERMRRIAAEILEHSDATKGYCLVWGLVDGVLAYELAAGSELTVIGIDDDAERIAQVRNDLYQAGVYGTRIMVQHVDGYEDLPYPGNFANLIVSERMVVEGQCVGPAAEMYRLVRPRGSAAVLSCPPVAETPVPTVEAWLNAAPIDHVTQETPAGLFYIVTKPMPPGCGSWTHQYGDTGNTANSHDDLNGATQTDQMRVQWLGKPGADFGLDRNPRMPAPLAANGKLFHQGMNRMVAIDAYNGTILWSLEVPAMRRVNLPRDASNWCTDDAALYVAIQGDCWVIGHPDGAIQQVVELPEGFSRQQYDWGYIARRDSLLLGSAVKKNTSYTEFWGHDAWYDRTVGLGTEKVCSDALFAYDLVTGQPAWTRRNSVVINTTIAVGKQGVFCVESRNPALQNSSTRRLNDSLLWSDQYLVCLDAQTGQLTWETPLDTADGIVVFYLACTDDSVVIASSGAGKYHLYRFVSDTGRFLWHAEHNWPADNHGAHMQHPVVLTDRIFLEPCGYDLATGQLLTSSMSPREGCATYCGTNYALVHRGQARCVAMWDFSTGRITTWRNLRPSCWLSTIVGEGMILSPEGGGGCSCGNWLETSMAFSPLQVSTTPVRRPLPTGGNAIEGGQ